MGTNVIDAFVVSFGLDAKDYDKGEREVEQATKRLNESNKKAFDGMEDRGKKAAETFKSVRNEVVGLGLAFMGASSIMNLVGGMMTGAAAADRLGTTMGMSTKQIWAWRMAMKGVGGQTADADAALQSVQKDRMAYKLGGMDGTRLNVYGRLGVSGNDLRDEDPGAILKKLSGAKARMDPQMFANLLQQLGLPQSMVYELEKGSGAVEKELAAFEKDARAQEKLAKESEQLQQTMATLQATIADKLVPPLAKLATILNDLVGGSGGGGGKPGEHVWGIPGLFEVKRGGGGGGGGASHGPSPARVAPGTPTNGDDHIMRWLMGHGFSHDQALGVRAGIAAEGDGRYNATSGAFGIGQWLGPRKAALFRKYGPNPSLDQQLEFLLSELKGGDSGGKYVLAETDKHRVMEKYLAKFMRPQGAHNEHLRDLMRDVSRGSNYIARHHHSSVKVTNHYNIKSTDPKGAAHEVSKLHRRHAVAQADRGVAP